MRERLYKTFVSGWGYVLQIWNELVDAFRALGGMIDNVRLAEGPLGRGLFPIDPTQPFFIRIPENLLVKTSDIVFENNALKVAPCAAVGEQERQFYEGYYAHLSWGGGGRAEIELIFEQAQALPSELRERLRTFYHLSDWFADPAEAVIQAQFVQSRKVGHQGHAVMMPFVELANHGSGGTYEGDNDLILQGTAAGEITVHYTSSDAFGLFRSWGFSAPEDVAYSIPLQSIIGETPLLIECRPDASSSTNRPGYPALGREGAAVKLSACMLGNRKFPRFCRGNFRHVLRTAGFCDVDETFDRIRMNNQLRFLSLLGDLEFFDGPMARSVRQMARFQLQALAHCFGTREVPLLPGTA